MRHTGVATLVVLAMLATGTTTADARTFGISVSDGLVSRLGPLQVKRHPHLADAVRAFGAPSSIRPGRGLCTVRWSRLGLKATFTSFGAITDFCNQGLFQTAVIRSPQWRTWAGLRVGMRSSRVPALHHRAVFQSGKWVLATQDLYGSEPAPTVSALVSGDRVRALSLWVGGAGD